MSDDHLHMTRALLRAHSDGALSDSDLLDLYRGALVSACPACAEEDRLHRAELQIGEPLSFYERLRNELRQSASSHQQPPTELLLRLLSMPQAERIRVVQDDRDSYSSPQIVALLLERARSEFPGNPPLIEEITELVQVLALRLVDDEDLDDFAYTAVVSALAIRACAVRVQDRLTEAREAIRTARLIVLRHRVTDHYTLAEVDLHEGALRRDRRQLPLAGELLSRAAYLFRLLKRGKDTFNALYLLADVERMAGRPEQGLLVLDAAERCVSNEPTPLSQLLLAQERALILCELRSFSAARQVISTLREQEPTPVDRSAQFRLLWTEGRIALGLGEHDEAQEALLAARAITRSLNNLVDSALISLDLALVHLDAGRPQGLSEIAAFLGPLLQEEGLHEEASAALGLLVDAIERKRLSLRLVQDLSQYLVAARHDPSMKFRQR